MAGWLDALLGQVFNNGNRIELSGGLNFMGGLRAVLNAQTGIVDVAMQSPPLPIVTEEEWDPAAGDSPILTVLAAGHAEGFYLVGINATLTGTPSGGGLIGAYTWGVDGGEAAGTGAAGNTDGRTYRSTSQPIYSDGGFPLTAQFTSSITGTGLSATVRAVAQRMSQ